MTAKEACEERVKELMHLRNMNALTVAKQAGLTPSTVYSFLRRDRKKVDISVVKNICTGLDVSLSEFFSSDLFEESEK